MGEIAITTTDVARVAAVSRVTVSRVLNNHPNVTDEMRQRVLQAAVALGYVSTRANARGGSRAFRTHRPDATPVRNIGFLFNSVQLDEAVQANPFWSQLLASVERAASAAAVHVTYRSIAQVAERPETLLGIVADAQLDGLLLVGPALERTIHLLLGLGLPLVLVDNYLRGASVDAVLSDNTEGARMAVEHLIAHGHRHIAFIGGPIIATEPPIPFPSQSVLTIEQRATGYFNALRAAGLPPNPDLFEPGDLTATGGYQACKRLLTRGASFTAIFCANDETAIGAMRALHKAAKRVPDDVSLIGFDDITLSKHLTPPLTTIHVEIAEMGATAFKALLARALDPDARPVTITLPVHLAQRDSVTPLHSNSGE